MKRPSKRLPFYVAGGAAISALAVAAGLLATDSGAASSSGREAAATTTIQTRTTGLGQIVVDGRGRTVYLFAKDTGDRSSCTGACASFWPPVPAGRVVHAGGGASAAELARITAPGGGQQLSYAGHPLYYFIGDHHAGDTNGQALNQFGATWYTLSPAGGPVTQTAADRGNDGYDPRGNDGGHGGY